MGAPLHISTCRLERAAAFEAIEAAFAEVARLERLLSSWQPTSEIGAVNAAAPNTWISLSPELADLLGEAERWVAATGGAFDPAVGALVAAWGFRADPVVPTEAGRERALGATGWRLAKLRGRQLMRGPPGWWLDTGGFGKGAALRSAADTLRARGVREAVLDFGGQLVAIGSADVSVADPRDRSRPDRQLHVRDVSVATSSQSERFVEADGRRYGHILDPRTGMPVPAWGSVTVITRDALAADALATALFVMGPGAALAWADEHPDVGVLVLQAKDGAVRAAWSRAITQWIWEKS